jgi:hypothetical protein
MAKMLPTMLIVVATLSVVRAEDKLPWDATPHLKCSEMITPAGEFTAKTEAMLTWLVGYIDGISAPALLDKRLKTIHDAGSQQIGPLVLAFCEKKQDADLITAATGVAEMVINAQSGKVLNLRLD